MKKTVVIVACLGILIFSIYRYTKFRESQERFSRIYVTEFGSGGLPCFNVKIGEKKLIFGLDLGLDADLSATSDLIQEIKERSFVNTVLMSGMQGGIYEENVYKIPDFKLGRLTVYNPLLNEESPEWEKESAIIHKSDPNVLHPSGRMGWRLFQGITLFLDLKNGSIVLGAGIDDLLKNGYSFEGFTKTALLIDHNFIEFTSQTPNGPFRCMLDSGCTSNLINANDRNDEPLEKLILDESRFIPIDQFEIGGHNCGPIKLRPIPIQFQVPVEVILGMEFLLNHQVFIDFPHQEIYFSTEKVTKFK
ncbi:MAG TPA: hypothetical protein PKW79_03575 [Rhabdochlamydiaceae bacterium]|nr:hypothetical protein [Rhabdochlamydiaceae bacterium]